jgi:hypothetical protein
VGRQVVDPWEGVEMPCERRDQIRDGVADSPVYWFSRFESAALKDDQEEARRAQERLRRLGYSVELCQASIRKGGDR